MQSSSPRRQSESGFTLIELLVIMLIVGILAAIALPPLFAEEDSTKVVTAEVCGVSFTDGFQLPDAAGGFYALDKPQPLTMHASYRFTLDTDHQTITSVEPVGKQEKVLRC